MKPYLPPLACAILAMSAGCATAGQTSTAPAPAPASPPAEIIATEIESDAGLDELLRYAAEHSPQMRAAFEEWRSAVEGGPQARSLPDPELSYGYWVDRSTERLGMMGRQRLTLTQMLPGFGKRGLREEVAVRGAEAAEQRLEAARLAVFARVKSAYAEYAYVEEAIEVLRELQELIEEIETVALARFRAGEVGSADVLRIEMEGENIAEELRTMEQMRRPAAAVLNAAVGLPEEAALPAPRLERLPSLAEGIERDFETWLAANPNLRAREREIARADAGVELARREGRPDFMVGAEVMERRGEETEGMIMVGVTLPIWRENYAAARREARANRNAAVERYRGLERDLEADLRMALFRVRDAERKIRLHGETLHPLALQTYNLLAAGYRTGDADFLNLVDAQRAVLDHDLLHRRAIADHIQRVAELERLIGGGFRGEVNGGLE